MQYGILCDDMVTIKWCEIGTDCPYNRIDRDRSRIVWVGPPTEYDPMPDERRRFEDQESGRA